MPQCKFCLVVSILLSIGAIIPGNVSVLGRCIFDDIQPTTVHKKSQTYNLIEDIANNRRKRATLDLYKPIRIQPFFHDIAAELTQEEQKKLKKVISDSVKKISQFLSVIHVKDRLLLGRSTASCMVYQDGPNAGKCANVQPSYEGETCTDNFKIPNAHLDGLYVWNSTHPEPVKVLVPPGAGLKDTDYVLYVRCTTTSTCVAGAEDVLAYTTFCQLDQNDRPIAGYVNFCPKLFKDPSLDDKKLSLTAIHELFHALGFTNKLFDKYKDCSSSVTGLDCPTRPWIIKTVRNAKRLVTPTVVQLASKHYNCSTHSLYNEFGPMLEIRDGMVRSHWDAAFLQGSIMAPNIQVELPHLTILDPFTLAAFEDSGWYRVNYHFAQKYIWGRGEKCEFGLASSCQTNTDCFCTGSGYGCHYLHKDKGHCATDRFLHRCRVYKATVKDNCQNSSNTPSSQQVALYGESYQEDSRCFMANLTIQDSVESAEERGRCYVHRCNGTKYLEVRVGNSPWVHCPFGKKIQVPGYAGFLRCPKAGVLCMKTSNPFNPEPEPEPEGESTPAPTPSTNPEATVSALEVLCVEVVFRDANYQQLKDTKQLELFTEKSVQYIVTKTGIHRRRLTDVKVPTGTLVLQFKLLPARYGDDGVATEQAYSVLNGHIKSKTFVITLPSGKRTRAVFIRSSLCGPTTASPDLPPSVIAGIVVGSLAAAIVIGTSVYLVQRYYALHGRVDPANHHTSPSLDNVRLQNRQPPIRRAESENIEEHHNSNRATSAVSTRHIIVDQFDEDDAAAV